MKLEYKGSEFKRLTFWDCETPSDLEKLQLSDKDIKFYNPLNRAIIGLLVKGFVIDDHCITLWVNDKDIVIGFNMTVIDSKTKAPFVLKMYFEG